MKDSKIDQFCRGLPSEQFELYKKITRWLNDVDSIAVRIDRQKRKNDKLKLEIDKQLHQLNQLSRIRRYLSTWKEQNKMPITEKSEKDIPANILLSQLSQAFTFDMAENQQVPLQPHCDIKSHIHQYLNTNLTSQKAELQEVTTKKTKLLSKITKLLSTDHPYHHEKFLQTIKNQMKSQGDRQAFTAIRKTMSNLISKPKNQINPTNRLTSLLSQNITLLKEIKQRKVINNDRIFECCQQLQAIENMKDSEEHIQRLKKSLESMGQKFQTNIIQRPQGVADHAQHILSQLDQKINTKMAEILPLLKTEKYSTDVNRQELLSEAARIQHRLKFIL